MRVLITGGAGFAGHHFIEHFLKETDWEIIVLDKLTYASNGFDRLRAIGAYSHPRVKCLASDFSQRITEGVRSEIGDVDYILHLGAETHVDKSIEDPEPFVRANVLGTMHMLNLARDCPGLKRFLYFSTDEVFGPAPEGVFYKEGDRYNSGNPYAATKAGGEELSMAYANTYGVPVLITHTMNMFGERQHSEKFIPLCISRVLSGEKIYVHSDKSRTSPGKRHYIHCRNVASAVLHLLGLSNEEKCAKVNIVGEREVDNLEMVRIIADHLGRVPSYELIDFHGSRPGHDLRYALDGAALSRSGYVQKVDFEASLHKTIAWYLKHREWLSDPALEALAVN